MDSADWTPPPDLVTSPDQISKAAAEEISLLDGERLARCWRTDNGFLVMTNLRVLAVWKRAALFAPAEWHEGASLFFYALTSPRVVLDRFVELSEGDAGSATLRVRVDDPRGTAGEIDAARAGGRTEWEHRRAAVEARLAPPRPAASGTAAVREIIREVVKVRCRFCGNLMDESQPHCPSCGAPQG